MKKNLIKLAAGAALIFATTVAQAIPIGGSIQFVGTATMNASQTAFIGFGGPGGLGPAPVVLAGSQTGDYAWVANGTAAIWTPFTFNPPAASVTPLWTFSIGAITYSFDATSMSTSHPDAFTFNIQGTGIAHITGLEDTAGIWTVTSTGSGTTFTFGASTQAGPQVPDGGTTVVLLGAALSGLAMFRRKLSL